MKKVALLLAFISKSIIERALVQQPLNYLIKPVDESALFTGIKLAVPKIFGNDRLGKRQQSGSILDQFTQTELKVLRFILRHKTSREIAAELFLSPYTVKNHRHNICRKLGLKNENNSLLQWAMQHKDLVE